MKSKETSQDADDNLSQILHIYPMILDSADLKYKGTFTTTIDKTTKAIKLHSIKTKPRRDPNKRNDPKYQAWVRQQEFNPFLINSWMLLGKAEFEEGNYLRAITTFLYISKIYAGDMRIVSESKLWVARSYSEMGWMYEAENVLRKMEQNNEIHHELLGMYASLKANVYVHNKNYESAIPYLEEAIKKESGSQKRRNKYLLAQLYQATGNNAKALQAYKNVRGYNAPYKYTLNSKLKEFEVSSMTEDRKIAGLEKMTKPQRNKEYLDQIYTALAGVYLHRLDTTNAIKNLALAINKSERNAYDKALAQIKLGGLYFDTQEYVKAQPHYSGALPQLKKSDENYPIVELRSEVLDQLVVHAKVVQEQDSLLNVANMPEWERTAYIEKHIEKLKRAEAEKKKQEELQRLEEGRKNVVEDEDFGWGSLAKITSQPQLGQQNQQEAKFYFYNNTAVEQGKVSFKRKWGMRPLEDDWRRKNKKTSNPFADEDELAEETQDEQNTEQLAENENENSAESTDIYSVEYYLQQLPLTDEEKVASGKLIENGLFNMGLVYKDLLEDRRLAVSTLLEDLSRFPDTPNREEIYYQLFLIYLQDNNMNLVADYRNRIIDEFPESKYTIPLRDENYAWNFTYMAKMQEELYQLTYDAYLRGDYRTIRKNYEEIQTKFPFVDLMSKFAFLNALSYAQTKDAKAMSTHLTKLITDYPQAEVTPLATDILKNIRDGKIILSDGAPIVGMDWSMAYSNDSIFEGEEARVIEYRADVDKPYVLLLMFQPKSIDRNELLYEVADYNFSNYVIQTYDLKFDEDAVLSALEIKGFKDFKTISSYINKAMEEDGLFEKMDSNILPVPMSTDNYRDIYPRLGMDEYMSFYTDSLSQITPQLMAYWGQEVDKQLLAEKEEEKQLDAKAEELKEEPKAIEPIEVKETEKIVETKPEEDKAEKVNDKEVNLEDVLSKEQVQAIGNINQKADDLVESISNLGSNPVEGLKNIFNRNKIEDNLTKEEKEELKQQQKNEKARQKEEKRLIKAREDSLARIEKIRIDSIAQVEKAIEDSIQMAIKQEKDQIAFEKNEKERLAKEAIEERKRQQNEKERERKEIVKERERQRKQQERERDEKLRERERERQKLMKQREQERKEKEKAAEELRKQRERERQELLKQREQEKREARRK